MEKKAPSLESGQFRSLIPQSIALERFENLDESVLLQILEWRNHPRIRFRMLNTQIISKEDHLAFTRSLAGDQGRIYFLVTLRKTMVGVIDFYRVAADCSRCYYGYYLRPEQLGSALGLVLEFIAAEYAFFQMETAELIAETREDNTAALRLHRLFGFEDMGRNERGLQESALMRTNWLSSRMRILRSIQRLA